MASERKLSLPLVFDLLAKDRASKRAPSVDAARKRLGGRGTSTGAAGSVVELTMGNRVHVAGVVLFASEHECDVWVDGGLVRRTRLDAVTPRSGMVSIALERIAADVRVFAALREGERVRYEPSPGTVVEGTLVEKCRYGALVLADALRGGGGKIVAVGFRKLWPAQPVARA
jgi:hypothetical protein